MQKRPELLPAKSLRFLCLTILSLLIYSYSFSIETPAEANKYAHYTTNSEIAIFLAEAENACPDLRVRIIGETLERDPLYLVIATKEGVARTNELSSERLTVYLFATQHGNEQSGKEALLRLIRELADGTSSHLLDRLNLLIVPLVNPHGAHHDKRRNEQELDLNRDHVKLEAPETRALHRVFHHWWPEVTLDIHERGDDYYQEQLGVVSNLNISPELQRYSKQAVLPYVEKALVERGISFHEYLIRQRISYDAEAAEAFGADESEPVHYLYRLSTTDINDGRNGFGIFNTLSFILEGVSSGSLHDLRERTDRQFQAIRFFLQFMAEHAAEVRELVRRERRQMEASLKVHMRMRYTHDPAQPELKILAYADVKPDIMGIMKTDRRKGEPLHFEDVQFLPPGERQVVERTIRDWRPRVESTSTRERPAAYVVPAERLDIVRTLLDHSVPVLCLPKEHYLPVEKYQVLELRPTEVDGKAPKFIKVKSEDVMSILPRGTFIVPAAGLYANLVPILLEPLSSYGLIRYARYRLLPREGEFYAIGRLHDLEAVNAIPYVKDFLK